MVSVWTPSPVARFTRGNAGPKSTRIAPRCVEVLSADASSCTTGVPESRTGAVSGGVRNTRRLAVTVVGLASIAVSRWEAESWNVVVCSAPAAGASPSSTRPA